jgi:hypothetical protein
VFISSWFLLLRLLLLGWLLGLLLLDLESVKVQLREENG